MAVWFYSKACDFGMKAVAGEAFESWPPHQRGRELTVPWMTSWAVQPRGWKIRFWGLQRMIKNVPFHAFSQWIIHTLILFLFVCFLHRVVHSACIGLLLDSFDDVFYYCVVQRSTVQSGWLGHSFIPHGPRLLYSKPKCCFNSGWMTVLGQKRRHWHAETKTTQQ